MPDAAKPISMMTAADIEQINDARRARGGTIDRKAVQLIANLAHHIHTRAVAIERQAAAGMDDQVVATVGQIGDIQDISSKLNALTMGTFEAVLDASGLSMRGSEPVSSAGARGPGALHDEPRANDGSGAATGPGPSSDAA